MDLSIDINYFINQIESEKDQELLNKYHTNLQKHISACKDIIKIKEELKNIIIDYQQIQQNGSLKNNIHMDKTIEELDKMINFIFTDSTTYKNLFKTQLFLLIKK